MMKYLTFALWVSIVGCNQATDAPATNPQPETVSAQPDQLAPAQPTSPAKVRGQVNPPPRLPDVTDDSATRPRLDGDPEARAARRAARRAAMMERLDTNGDNVISDEEREVARKEREAARLARLDTDGDGKVSDAERTEALTERATNTHARMDANGDGSLTPDELSNRFRGDVSKMDADGNGTISVEELRQAMSERRGGFRRGGGRGGWRGGGRDDAGAGSAQ